MTESPFSATARLVVDPCTARIKASGIGGHRARECRKRQTGAAGQEGGRAPWRQDGFRQTAARVARRTTPLECGEGERRRGVSRRRHSGRRCRAVACSRHLEMREDLCNDGGFLDRGDQLHPASAARTAQNVQVEGPAHERRPRPVAGAWRRLGLCRRPPPGSPSAPTPHHVRGDRKRPRQGASARATRERCGKGSG